MNDKIKHLIAEIRKKREEWERVAIQQKEKLQKMTERTQLLTAELLQEKVRVATLETQIATLKEQLSDVAHQNSMSPSNEVNSTDVIAVNQIDPTHIDNMNLERISELLRETQYYLSRIKHEHEE